MSTMLCLCSILGATAAYSIEESEVYSREYIREIQKDLEYLGFNPGPLDGQCGHMTQQAIRSFQRELGLMITGDVSEALREALLREALAGKLIGGYPLALAKRGQIEGIRRLVEDGLDINKVFECGATMLLWAAFEGHGDLVEFLLDEGARPNLTGTLDINDKQGYWSPIIL